jgi:hypothetical protein
MYKLLATAFGAALSALAMTTGRELTAQHVGPLRARRAASAPRRTERGEINDPYWSPCDYSSDWAL